MEVLVSPTEVFNLNQPTSKLIDQKMCVYDCSDKEYQDFFFKKISTFILYRYPTATITLDDRFRIELPLNWKIMVTNDNEYVCKMCPIEDLLHFDTNQIPVFNPFHPGLPKLMNAEIYSINPNPVEHFVPKLPKKNLLVMPLDKSCVTEIYNEKTNNRIVYPNCIYCIDDLDSSKIEFDLWSMIDG